MKLRRGRKKRQNEVEEEKVEEGGSGRAIL
jgi:hypothetical protein